MGDIAASNIQLQQIVSAKDTHSEDHYAIGIIHMSHDNIRVNHQSIGRDPKPHPSFGLHAYCKDDSSASYAPIQIVGWGSAELTEVLKPGGEVGVLG